MNLGKWELYSGCFRVGLETLLIPLKCTAFVFLLQKLDQWRLSVPQHMGTKEQQFSWPSSGLFIHARGKFSRWSWRSSHIRREIPGGVCGYGSRHHQLQARFVCLSNVTSPPPQPCPYITGAGSRGGQKGQLPTLPSVAEYPRREGWMPSWRTHIAFRCPL